MTEMNDTKTVKDLLDLSISAEEDARVFYSELTKMFMHVPDISDKWKEMMNDELLHKNRIENIFSQLSEEELNSPAPDILQKLRRTLRTNSLKDKLSSVKTLEDAYEIAYWFENSEVNIALEVILSRFVTSEDRTAFVDDLLNDHIVRLRGFGSAEWRQNIKAKK